MSYSRSSSSVACAPKKKVATKEPAAAEKPEPTSPFDSKPIVIPARRSALSFSDLHDCQVVCLDGTAKVERSLFARFSPQMKAMLFDNKLKEAQSGQVVFKDITCEVFTTIYQVGLGEFLRLPEVRRPFAELQSRDLIAAIRFTHAYEMHYILAQLLCELTKRVPEQDFFDLDGELELGVQSLLLDRLLEHFREDPAEKVVSFSDPEIYRTLWPVLFGAAVQALFGAPMADIRQNFIQSLTRSKIVREVLAPDTLELKNVPRQLLAKLAETMDGETAKIFLLRALRE